MEYDQLVQSPIERDRSNYVECLYFQSAACRFGDTVCSYLFCFDSPKTRVYSTFGNLLFFRVFGERLKDTKKPDLFEQKKSSKNSRFQTAQPFNLRASFVKIQGGGERPRWRFTLCTSKKYVQTSCCRPRAQWSIEGLGRKNKWMMGGTNRGAWWWVTGNQGVFLLFKEMCGSRFLFRNMFLEGDVRWIGGIGRWVGGYMSW